MIIDFGDVLVNECWRVRCLKTLVLVAVATVTDETVDVCAMCIFLKTVPCQGDEEAVMHPFPHLLVYIGS